MTPATKLDDHVRPSVRGTAPGADLEPYLAEMRGYRATYVRVIEAARASDPKFDVDLALRALAEFQQLEDQLLEAKTPTARETLVERAEEVEQSRAYIQPESEIVAEATTKFADMVDWGVPREALQAIDNDLMSVIKSDATSLHEKRAALNKLYQYFDAWFDHTDKYEAWMKRTAWGLTALLFATSVACVFTILECKPVHGFVVSGLTGALLSVLGKFPPMLGWGQWAAYTPLMLGRITTGLVTTLVGGAVLALDIIKIGNESFDSLFKTPDRKHMVLVVGFGIVFGFTERLLVSFQEMIFKPGAKSER